MKESDLNKKIQDYIRSKGGYVFKTIATNRSGVPDIVACLNGHFIAIEGKMPGNKASLVQLQHLKLIMDAGGIARVAYSLDDVKDLIEEHDLLSVRHPALV